jgi:hypothetical protein
MKGLNDECEHFEAFPPGHLYSSKEHGFKRWYNPLWYSHSIPSTPFDPLALRKSFEDVYYLIIFFDLIIVKWYRTTVLIFGFWLFV